MYIFGFNSFLSTLIDIFIINYLFQEDHNTEKFFQDDDCIFIHIINRF